MKQRLASMFLLLVLFGGAFAGVPMTFGDSHCGMGAMDIECCKAMLRQQNQPKFTQEEELLCALNCAQNGTTLPSSALRLTPPVQTLEPAHPTIAQPLHVSLFHSGTTTRAHSPPGSPPTYLRNLTLQI